MSQLEFALIPIGIVMGYGVTRILRAWATVINNWGQSSSSSLLYLSASALALLVLFLNFTGLWSYRGVDFGVGGNESGMFNVLFLFVITMPVLLIMLAISVLTEDDGTKVYDLERHYFEVSKKFFVVFAIAILSSVLPDFLPGVGVTPDPWPAIGMASVILLLALVDHRVSHLVAHILIWLLMAMIFVLFY